MKTRDKSFKRRNYVGTLLQFALGLTVVAAGMAVISEPDTSITRVTAQRKYLVAIRPLARTPDAAHAQTWEISLRSPAGRPVSPAQIDADTARVTRQLGDGRYLLEGIGRGSVGQQIRLNIYAFDGADQVIFNTATAARRPGLLARTVGDVT